MRENFRAKKAVLFRTAFKTLRLAAVRDSNKFIDDLKRIAELDAKPAMLMKLRKEREKLIPKVVDKNKNIRAKRKLEKRHCRIG